MVYIEIWFWKNKFQKPSCDILKWFLNSFNATLTLWVYWWYFYFPPHCSFSAKISQMAEGEFWLRSLGLKDIKCLHVYSFQNKNELISNILSFTVNFPSHWKVWCKTVFLSKMALCQTRLNLVKKLVVERK